MKTKSRMPCTNPRCSRVLCVVVALSYRGKTIVFHNPNKDFQNMVTSTLNGLLLISRNPTFEKRGLFDSHGYFIWSSNILSIFQFNFFLILCEFHTLLLQQKCTFLEKPTIQQLILKDKVHVDLTVLSIFQKAVTFDNNLTH